MSRHQTLPTINAIRAKIFEIVRVSYLLANSKAVVSDVYPESYIEQDIAAGVTFVSPAVIADACWDLLVDDDRRHRLERGGFACFSRRDIRTFLAAALA